MYYLLITSLGDGQCTVQMATEQDAHTNDDYHYRIGYTSVSSLLHDFLVLTNTHTMGPVWGTFNCYAYDAFRTLV